MYLTNVRAPCFVIQFEYERIGTCLGNNYLNSYKPVQLVLLNVGKTNTLFNVGACIMCVLKVKEIVNELIQISIQDSRHHFAIRQHLEPSQITYFVAVPWW